MGKLCAVISCLLLSVGGVASQTAQAAAARALPQWLTGIIAVVAFLLVAFVGLLVKKSWCEEPRRTAVEVRENDFVMTNGDTYETSLDAVRSKDDANAYENPMMETTEEKVTAM